MTKKIEVAKSLEMRGRWKKDVENALTVGPSSALCTPYHTAHMGEAGFIEVFN